MPRIPLFLWYGPATVGSLKWSRRAGLSAVIALVGVSAAAAAGPGSQSSIATLRGQSSVLAARTHHALLDLYALDAHLTDLIQPAVFAQQEAYRRLGLRERVLALPAVVAIVQPVKMNYEIHGNTAPHLHVHFFPRYVGDQFEGGPINPRAAKRPAYAPGVSAWMRAISSGAAPAGSHRPNQLIRL